MKKDLISIVDFDKDDILDLLDLTKDVKANKSKYECSLKSKCIGLIFQKPSNRTRVSFEIGMVQLGGYAMYLGPHELEMGKRESVKDVASVLARYLDGLVARTYSHSDVAALARHADIPVINGLSDFSHPCQALADFFTVKEEIGRLKGVKIAFIGDGNNVCNSLLYICAKLGVSISVATPKGYEPDKEVYSRASEQGKMTGAKITLSNRPAEAVKGADIIYTDVWTSMGQEEEKAKRLRAFRGFQINGKLCSKADKDFMIMHCLPAHRGEEITDECMESRHSIVFDQAENRMHVEKAILLLLLK